MCCMLASCLLAVCQCARVLSSHLIATSCMTCVRCEVCDGALDFCVLMTCGTPDACSRSFGMKLLAIGLDEVQFGRSPSIFPFLLPQSNVNRLLSDNFLPELSQLVMQSGLG